MLQVSQQDSCNKNFKLKEFSLLPGTDGSTLLGLVAGLGALVLVFLLYINKKWWWGAVGGMSCCDEACPPVSARPVPSPPVPSTSMSPPFSKNKLGK